MKVDFAVLGATLVVEPAPGSTGVGGVATFVTAPGLKARANGKAIYTGDITISVSGVTNPTTNATIPSGTSPDPETFTLSPTSAKCRIGGKKPLRIGDKVSVLVNPLVPATPSPTPSPTSMVVRVANAGQQKVRGS